MIAVLMGGNSAERDVSLKSGEAVYQALKEENIACFKFDWHGDNLSDLWTHKFDRAFIILHGRGGEDGYIQKQLDDRKIPYTGSGAKTSRLCMDKSTTKDIWSKNNLPIAASIIAKKNAPIPNIEFSLPWAVKPTLEGSSIGISKVQSVNDLQQALNLAWKYGTEAMIEQWIEGEEYTVAIVNKDPLPAIKIVSTHTFYDYESKYQSHDTRYLCPCGLNDEQEKYLQNLALKAFEVMGAKDWGRVDFILDKNDQPYLLEINTVPGMTSHSLVPMAAKAVSISFNQLVVKILNG